jgi:hypothetical protein
MEVMTLVWFAGGFFGQLSIVIIRLRAILMLATQLLSCVQLPPGGESCWSSDSLITVNSLNVDMLKYNKAIICVDLRKDTKEFDVCKRSWTTCSKYANVNIIEGTYTTIQ